MSTFLKIHFFRIYAVFEADIEIDSSCKVDKTTNIHKQNPACNGYYKVSQLKCVPQSG